MRTDKIAVGALALLLAGAAMAATPPPIEPERFTVEKLPEAGPHWVYVVDIAWLNEIDERARILDGDTGRELGQLDLGFMPGIAISPDRKTTAVSTTYFARGGHGQRTDVVEFHDNSTLTVKGEVVLPTRRANMPPAYTTLAWSSDGALLYVPYLTPASSMGVIDAQSRKVLGEIDTAGCAMVIAHGPRQVSMLCDSGRMMTLVVDDSGKETARSMSDVFFDPENDPIMVQGIPMPAGMAFISYLGDVHEVDFSGPQPRMSQPWPLVGAADRGHWRPGGTQSGTYHAGTHRLYVPMHQGGEGSHKMGGTEIWVFDTTTHKRVARWPLAPTKLESVVALQVTGDDKPLLFGATEDGAVAVFDAMTGRLQRVARNMGQTPWYLISAR